MAGKASDIWLIPEFHGVSSNHMVSEWLEQVELVCEVCSVDNVEHVLPLRLRSGALSVYRRLTCDQREDLQQVKQALLVAFAPDPFVIFDTFLSRRLPLGETVYKYLGDLQDLPHLIEENTSDWWLSCAFVSGLPGPVRWQLRGSSRMEHMTLELILARARALMAEEADVDNPVAEFFLVCLWPHLQPPTSQMQSQCNATSVAVPITLPETVGSPGANHGERSWRYAVISANNKDMSHRGVQEN